MNKIKFAFNSRPSVRFTFSRLRNSSRMKTLFFLREASNETLPESTGISKFEATSELFKPEIRPS